MTKEQVEKLEEIKKDMEIYDRAISVFDINKHFTSILDRYEAKAKANKFRFGYFLECLRKGNKNCVRLNVKGYFGGQSIEVDQEFVDMCLSYFKKKREELEKEFEAL